MVCSTNNVFLDQKKTNNVFWNLEVPERTRNHREGKDEGGGNLDILCS